VEAPFLRCFEKVTEKHLWSVYHQMLIVLICFNYVWDMFNYLAWVMKINQTNVMFHSIFVLIYMLIYKLLEYKNQLWLHFPINLNFQPYQLNAEKGMDKNMGQILDLYIATKLSV